MPSITLPTLPPIELTTAATMATVAAVIVAFTSVVPYTSGLSILATIPFGVLAQRYRPRSVLAATVAASLVTFVLVGLGAVISIVVHAVVGATVGELKRRGRGLRSAAVAALVLGAGAAMIVDGVLLLFGSYRRLVFDTARQTVAGFRRTAQHYPYLQNAGRSLDRATDVLLDYWALSFAVVTVLMAGYGFLLTWFLLGRVLGRLNWVTSIDRLASASSPRESAEDEAPGPLPATFTGVTFRYPNSVRPALDRIDLHLAEGEFVAVIGANGSGKSTLGRLLAGVAPTNGSIDRPGAPGLGRFGGTSLIGQRPDAQVLGSSVAEDLHWGLPPGYPIDVEGLLTDVGLAGLAGRETRTLSGGQLQRLAIAAALVRHPALLISDESTAMLDGTGRDEIIRLLAGLVRSRPMTVVHITHSEQEAAAADRVIRLDGGRLVDDRPGRDDRPSPIGGATSEGDLVIEAGPMLHSSEPLISVEALGHAYASGTPWEHPTLHDLSFTVERGEGVVIVGNNGSGKSTLAWVLAGVLRPTSGRVRVGDRDAYQQIGQIGLGFQTARLQLQRPTVGEDIAEATGWSVPGRRRRRGKAPAAASMLRDRVAGVLERAGLDPGLAGRSIDDLSGGQMRRVAIAGLLARNPRVLILDEPLAGLDAESQTGLIATLASLRSDGLTLIVISHDTSELSAVCPRTITLDAGRIAHDTAASPITPAAVR